MGLHHEYQNQRMALEKQANDLHMEYQRRKSHEDMQNQHYEMHKKSYEEQMKFHQEMQDTHAQLQQFAQQPQVVGQQPVMVNQPTVVQYHGQAASATVIMSGSSPMTYAPSTPVAA